MNGPRRRPAAASIAVGLTAAIAIVALASRAPLSHSTPVNAVSARTPVTALVMLLLGAAVLGLAALVALIVPARRRKGPAELQAHTEPLSAHWLWKLAALVVPLLLGAALIAAAALGVRTSTPTSGRGVLTHGPTPVVPAHPQAGRGGYAVPSWLPWTVLAIVLVGAAVVVTVLRARRESAINDQLPQQIGARAAVRAAIGALDSASDPRRAVIAAYVAMEHELATHGIARLPAEAPREYLGRVLAETAGAEREARTLTGLFEEARFSTHPIPERVRELALSALNSLRSRLEVGVAR
jgi:Domain of unknown function (DUF4129)